MRKQRGCLIFGGMVFLLLLVSGLKAQARNEGLLVMAAALGLMLVFVQFQARISQFVRRHFQPEAEDALLEDDRPSILFLRSFNADNQFMLRTAGLLGRLLGKVNVPLEASLTQQFRDFGPVIAIGRPGEPLPPLGASRFYAPKDGEEWKRHVREFARDSQLVAVMLGETEGLRWEYDLLANENWLGKTVFIVPLVTGASLQKVLQLFRKYTDARDIQIVGPVDADVVVFAPGGKGRLIPLSSPGLRTRQHLVAPLADHYRKPIGVILNKASAAGSPPKTKTTAADAPVRAPAVSSSVKSAYASSASEIATDEMRLAEAVTDAESVVMPRRTTALFIDWVIAVLGFSLLTLIVSAVGDPTIFEHPSGSPESEKVNEQMMMTGMMLSPLYFLVMESLLGISLGKRWLGLRVVTCDGAIPARRETMLRGLIKAASMFICVFPFAAYFAWSGKCWHDSATKTKVVAIRRD